MDIDLNADLGEGAGFDAELMPLVTSANVCCGLHAGGPEEVARTLFLAAEWGVTVGAHPGYADREHFGRRDMPDVDVFALCIYQLAAVVALGREWEAPVQYVKLHGALYHRAGTDEPTARSILIACGTFGLPIVSLPFPTLRELAPRLRVPFIPEGFADRRYRPDGSLVPRTEPDAFVHDPAEAVAQVEWLVREKGVRTICVHGDNPDAVAFTTAVRTGLLAHGFTLKAFA